MAGNAFTHVVIVTCVIVVRNASSLTPLDDAIGTVILLKHQLDIMSTILFTWELGGGLGHVTRIRPLAEQLYERGHRVIIAARNVTSARRVVNDEAIECVQAPFVSHRPVNAVSVPLTYAHILHNIGFANSSQLSQQVEQWRRLFADYQPDTVVFDHSPTALLAARWSPARRIVFGDGFCCPPETTPLPDLRPWQGNAPEMLRQEEGRTLSVANSVLRSGRQHPLHHLSELYSDCDDTLLNTFRELDHFNRDDNSTYLGAWPNFNGTAPNWPEVSGKKVFAYLKTDQYVGHLLELLRISGQPTLVYIDGIPPQIRQRHEGHSLRFATEPLDLRYVAAECDFAILNATLGATSAILLGGKPILQLPIYLEQSLTARNTVRLGAGLAVNRSKPEEVAFAFRRMLESTEFDQSAMDFATKYGNCNALEKLNDQVDRMDATSHRRSLDLRTAG